METRQRRDSSPSGRLVIATQRIAPPDDQASVAATFLRRFDVDVQPEREVVRVSPSGDIDLATVRTLRARIDELTEAGFEHLVLDLRGATFLDSTGLHLMIELDESARAHGRRFSIVEGPTEVQRAFEITGLRATLPFLDAGEVPFRR